VVKIRPIPYQEIVLHQLMSLNSLLPHYYSMLLSTAVQLLTDEEIAEMEGMIGKVELMVNGEERKLVIDEGGEPHIVVTPKGQFTLYDIEMVFESSQDYYAYIEREDGVVITRFDVERELDKIRRWIYMKVKQRAMTMRFNRM
jgi:hypothetical protein